MESKKVTIGSATLYLGDCLEILPTLEKVDAVITDPPYGIGYKPQKHNSKKSMGNRNFCSTDQLIGDSGNLDFNAAPIYSLFSEKPQIWWGANNYADSLPRSRGWLVWYKADGMEKTDFSHAEIAWTSLDSPIRGLNYLWMGMCKKGEKLRSVHPTQKPLAVMTWCVQKISPIHEIILDPFMGSGTTGVACMNLGRKFIGIEIEPKYFEIACKRIEAAQQQVKMFEPSVGFKQEQITI